MAASLCVSSTTETFDPTEDLKQWIHVHMPEDVNISERILFCNWTMSFGGIGIASSSSSPILSSFSFSLTKELLSRRKHGTSSL